MKKFLCSYTCWEICSQPYSRDPSYEICRCNSLYWEKELLLRLGAIIHDPTDPSSVYYDDSILKEALKKAGIPEKVFWRVLGRGELLTTAIVYGRVLGD